MSVPPFLSRPAGVEDHLVRTGRGAFAGLRAVPAACGWTAAQRLPALLVPGFTGSKEDFLAVLAPLGAAGHPVLAFDQRGQFESPGSEPPEGWTLEAFGADVLALAAAFGAGQPVHLLGHSFGGLVTRAAVLADPAAFASLTLLGSGPAGFSGAPADDLLRMAAGLADLGPEQVWQAKVVHDAERGATLPDDPDLAAFLHRRFVSNDPVALAAKARLLAAAPDRTGELAAVAPRTLVAYGQDDDAWSPKTQAEMASRLGATRVSLPEAAHSPAAERPADTAELLAGFWADVEGSERR